MWVIYANTADGDFDYLPNKLKWVRKEQGENRFFQSFYPW